MSHGPLTILSDDEEMFRDAVAGFAADEVKPRVQQMERDGKIDPALYTKFFEMGLMGVEVPEELGGAGLGRVDQQRKFLAGLELGGRLQHQRMAGQGFVEGGEYLQRLGGISLPRQKTAVTLHHAQRGRIELVGALKALGGFFLLAGDVEDHRGVQILEDRVPVRSGKLVDGVSRGLDLGRARHRPCRQQGRGKVGDRAADRLGEFATRNGILFLLDRAHPEHEPRDPVGLVDLQNAFGELDRFLDLAVRQHRRAAVGDRQRSRAAEPFGSAIQWTWPGKAG